MASKKPKATDKAGNLVRQKVEVRHDFTADEFKARTGELTRIMQHMDEKEDAHKAAAAVAKSEIKRLKAQRDALANQLQNGYEMQEVEASVEFNRKKAVKKLFHHCPGKAMHGDFISEQPMTESDYELLPLSGDTEPKPGEPLVPVAAAMEAAENGGHAGEEKAE